LSVFLVESIKFPLLLLYQVLLLLEELLLLNHPVAGSNPVTGLVSLIRMIRKDSREHLPPFLWVTNQAGRQYKALIYCELKLRARDYPLALPAKA